METALNKKHLRRRDEEELLRDTEVTFSRKFATDMRKWRDYELERTV